MTLPHYVPDTVQVKRCFVHTHLHRFCRLHCQQHPLERGIDFLELDHVEHGIELTLACLQITPLPPEPPPETGPPPMPAAPALPSPIRAPSVTPVPSGQAGMDARQDNVASQPVLPRQGMVVLEARGGSLETFCRRATAWHTFLCRPPLEQVLVILLLFLVLL